MLIRHQSSKIQWTLYCTCEVRSTRTIIDASLTSRSSAWKNDYYRKFKRTCKDRSTTILTTMLHHQLHEYCQSCVDTQPSIRQRSGRWCSDSLRHLSNPLPQGLVPVLGKRKASVHLRQRERLNWQESPARTPREKRRTSRRQTGSIRSSV